MFLPNRILSQSGNFNFENTEKRIPTHAQAIDSLDKIDEFIIAGVNKNWELIMGEASLLSFEERQAVYDKYYTHPAAPQLLNLIPFLTLGSWSQKSYTTAYICMTGQIIGGIIMISASEDTPETMEHVAVNAISFSLGATITSIFYVTAILVSPLQAVGDNSDLREVLFLDTDDTSYNLTPDLNITQFGEISYGLKLSINY